MIKRPFGGGGGWVVAFYLGSGLELTRFMKKKFICLNLLIRASRNFKSVSTFYHLRRMERVCIHLLLYKHFSDFYDCTCTPGYTDSGRLCTGLFSVNSHFPIYFRHSISLDSCLLKFSFRFFFTRHRWMQEREPRLSRKCKLCQHSWLL